MKNWQLSLIIVLSLGLCGCVVRTYDIVKERPDQDLSLGNRGFLKGVPETAREGQAPKTRSTKVVEVELYPFVKFENRAKQETQLRSAGSQVLPEAPRVETPLPEPEEAPEKVTAPSQKYIVRENDTLQKIAKKFYGTTRKWTLIYEANKANLRGPDKIRPGQVLEIPPENLK